MNLSLANKNPFSTFDFLGYLFPGAFMLILAYALSDGFKHPDVTNLEAYKQIRILAYDSTVIGSLLFIVFSYISGHIVSYLSSVTIESFYIWCYGYPTNYLFAKENDCKIKPILLIEKCGWQAFWRIIIYIVIFPIVIAHCVFEKELRIERFISKPLPEKAQVVICKKAINYFKAIGFNDLYRNTNDWRLPQNIDAHRFVMHYVYEHCREHIVKFDNYIALYGFLRSLSFIFSLSFVYFLISFINKGTILFLDCFPSWSNDSCHRWGIFILLIIILSIRSYCKETEYISNVEQTEINVREKSSIIINSVVIGFSLASFFMMLVGMILSFFVESNKSDVSVLLFLLFASSYISYLAFAKFYRRFSLENYMALVVCKEINEKEDDSKIII